MKSLRTIRYVFRVESNNIPKPLLKTSGINTYATKRSPLRGIVWCFTAIQFITNYYLHVTNVKGSIIFQIKPQEYGFQLYFPFRPDIVTFGCSSGSKPSIDSIQRRSLWRPDRNLYPRCHGSAPGCSPPHNTGPSLGQRTLPGWAGSRPPLQRHPIGQSIHQSLNWRPMGICM